MQAVEADGDVELVHKAEPSPDVVEAGAPMFNVHAQSPGQLQYALRFAERHRDIFTIGNARPLEEALQYATTEMAVWLHEEYGLDISAASHLLGQAVRYDIGNVYDPAFTVACRLSKQWLPK